MTDTATTTRITQVGAVFVRSPTRTGRLSSTSTRSGSGSASTSPTARASLDRGRPPGAANTIALVAPGEGKPTGGDETYCTFATQDIEADHAALLTRGVDVDAEIARTEKRRPGLVSLDVTVGDPVPAQFFFRDVDGNRFLIVQPD
jgi:hypothetical protein